MLFPLSSTHPEGEGKFPQLKPSLLPSVVDTYAGKVHVNWDPSAAVTPIGQLVFFIEFLKQGGCLDSWIDSCPLEYKSNNAPKKRDVLGSLFLSILSGHRRYAHLASLSNDQVSSELLGMEKVVSDDCALRALKRITKDAGEQWLQPHLRNSYQPLMNMPWILDIDTTVKPLYGHQEGAVVGYNPHKPGRPSHTYHTYFMANLRLALDVEVHAGDQSHSNYSLPGLLALLKRLPAEHWPEFVRGDIGFGTDLTMSELEMIAVDYLFKLRKSPKVKQLIAQLHGQGEWTRFNRDWEGKASTIQLSGWTKPRRVVIVRKRFSNEQILALEQEKKGRKQLSLIDEPEDMRLFEYSVLVTSMDCDLVELFHHYRDRADCENAFDELKNQWGWCGYTTQDIARCQHTARIIALIYNWWNLYVRLALPEKHYEAITSRPLLLNGVARMTESGRQKFMIITQMHGDQSLFERAHNRLNQIFTELKSNAPQLSLAERWHWLLEKATEKFRKITSPPLAQNST